MQNGDRVFSPPASASPTPSSSAAAASMKQRTSRTTCSTIQPSASATPQTRNESPRACSPPSASPTAVITKLKLADCSRNECRGGGLGICSHWLRSSDKMACAPDANISTCKRCGVKSLDESCGLMFQKEERKASKSMQLQTKLTPKTY